MIFAVALALLASSELPRISLPRTPVNRPLRNPSRLPYPVSPRTPPRGIQLVDHPLRSRLGRILRMEHLRRRADHEDPGAWVRLPQRAHEIQAVPVGQSSVDERNVYAF